jgi:hypothetical protein
VTASDSAPRSVILELYVSHDQKDGLRIRQNATITPTQTMFVLFAPLGVSLDDLSVTLRDPKTEQRLATATASDSFTPLHPLLADAVSQLAVISGSPDTSPILQTQLNDTGAISCRWVDPIKLPSLALGYDAMNLLILNSPDLGKISADQQEAMINWVRGGGNLLCWIGPEGLPGPNPLLDALPAAIGSNSALTLSSHVMSARELTPALNSKRISLLNDQMTAWQRRLGFGTITLLPIDPSAVSFDKPEQWLAFWSPLLGDAVDPRSRVKQEQVADSYVDAVIETRQALGEDDHFSSFDFRLMWLALLLAAGVAGPLDWFVLKKLKRKAWTYSTIPGWIGFIALCGVGVVRASMDEPNSVRSIELIDQADGIAVARILAMSGNEAVAETDLQSWYEPLAVDKTILPRTDRRTDLDLHEDQHGARAGQSSPNRVIGQMLLSQSFEPAAPLVSAALRLESKDGKPSLVGTITNLSTSPLENPTIRTKDGAWTLQTLPAGATVNIDSPLTPGGIPPARVWNLAMSRSAQIESLLSRDDHLACFTATSLVATPRAIYLRALISMTP